MFSRRVGIHNCVDLVLEAPIWSLTHVYYTNLLYAVNCFQVKSLTVKQLSRETSQHCLSDFIFIACVLSHV